MMWPYDPQGGLYVGGNDFGVVAPAPPPLAPEALEMLVRFEHPAKVLSVAEFPGAAALDDTAVAAAYGTDVEALCAMRELVRLRCERGASIARHLQLPPKSAEAILSLDEGQFEFVDTVGEKLTGERKINVRGVVLGGKWWHSA